MIKILFYWLRVFHTSVSEWFSTGGWVTARFFKSRGFLSVFWPISTIALFWWPPLVLLYPSPPVPIPILWSLYRARQLQLVSPSLSCSISLLFYSFEIFFTPALADGFSLGFLSDSKSPQVSRTLLNIQADLNNFVVSMVSICPLISKSSSPCTNPLEIVPSAPITISIPVTFKFHICF